mgnify:CR=1 FL=1
MAEVFSPKKITLRDCNLNVKQLESIAIEHQQAKVMRFVGIIISATEEPAKNDSKPYYVLRGDFAAVNLVTGDTYKARSAILPEVATIPILDLLDEGKKVNASSIRVAVDIAVQYFKPRTEQGLKYKFVASALIKPSEKTLLEDILASIDIPMPKLLGVVSSPESEPSSEQETPIVVEDPTSGKKGKKK